MKKKRTDTQRLDWCALYLVFVETKNERPKRKTIVEIQWNDEGEDHSVEGVGGSIVLAFRDALEKAMDITP